MKNQDFDLKPIQMLMDRINEAGCTYASLNITSSGKDVRFEFYTPQVGHHRFTSADEMIPHLEVIASNGEGSVALALAESKVARLRAEIVEAQDQIREAEEVIKAASSTDSDGVPI